MSEKVAVLGTGIMGAGMARSLLRAGVDVTVWNRDARRAEPLAADGALVAPDPPSAVAGADVVLTMLFDGPAVTEVMTAALPAVDPSAIWLQSSTVGLEATADLVSLADRFGVSFVDAPVLGTRQPAEQGKLTVLAAGPEPLRERLATVLSAVAARTIWVSSRPGDGHRLKLVANAWVLSITAATAQSIALAEGLGLDPNHFLDVISGGPTDSGYAQAKGRNMIAGEFAPAFAVDGAAKDAGLILTALRETGVDDRLMAAVRAQFAAAVTAGHAGDDMSAVIRVMAP
ncbi:3-hydroxyisobutyrate dehydrogenase [Actinophytocola xinjiangensis]|uniref:3-hydroxyisobutyrate dehydrogenase n=1 Tax=Actinophytocola xinjiangensis TaxID=485602 RepID=A0A7Z0WNU7_9PSEU|nr:NAD(P)-dependent oxidoreductase [Actinophytocola xinjiangensis]OLF12001.1 3-hydroxyisobutyrate dehydrogenase [Actinophytocola xinjiangensis]